MFGSFSSKDEAEMEAFQKNMHISDVYPYFANGGGVGTVKTYKLRAEGLNDFLAFLQTGMYMKIKSFTVEPIGVPDVVVTFETESSLSEIKSKLKEVPDSHVMLQTVMPINEYTGERNEEYADGGGIEKFASGAKFTNSVNHLKDFIRQYPYIWTKNGKEYVPIEGWQYAALLMGYSARVTSVEQMGAGYMANADVVDSRGNVVCSGFGYVDSNEAKWANKPVYQLVGFAQTRAVSRALRNCLSWMVKAAGYSTTPAEEMYGITPEKRGGGMKSKPFVPPAAPQEPDFIFDEPKYKAPMAPPVPPAPVMPEDMGGLDAQQIEDTLREMNAKAKANNMVIVSPEFMDKIKDALLGTNTDLHMSMLNQAIDYMDKNNIVLQTPRYMSKLRKIASQKPF
jgi:hypothetical protein